MNASGLIICETVSFLFAVLMPLERPRRQVRRAPYLPVGTGLPRPPARLRLPSVRKSAVVGTTDSKDDPIEARARADTLPVRLASGKLGVQLVGTARASEDQERARLAGIWAGFARTLASSSASACDFSSTSAMSLRQLFLDRAPSTLRRHLSGWRLWVAFCSIHDLQPGAPPISALLDFLESLSVGALEDRGNARQRNALGVLGAMTFAGAKLSLESLQTLLREPMIQSWKKGDKWKRSRVKEAVPIPFFALEKLEQVVAGASGDDRILLCAILLMAWGSLRWSDLQRLDLQSITSDATSIRGWCWRTKSSVRGMPWGVLRCGCAASNWGDVLFNVISEIRAQRPTQDFFIGWNGKPMPYTIMLSQFRRCLVLVAGLEREVAWTFSLHSLKCTLLSWALQCKVDPVERAAQGHHRHHGFSQCVQRYSRDDVTPQLNCQRALLKVLGSGWRPGVPLQRGVGCLMHERAGQESDTESDSSGSSSPSAALSDLDNQSVGGSENSLSDAAELEGPWLLNTLSCGA